MLKCVESVIKFKVVQCVPWELFEGRQIDIDSGVWGVISTSYFLESFDFTS